uniref:RNA-binding motif protein, X-linked 2-like isoform X1 n=1 Tax=Styela clava TaxID=7725 RepID=UPI0019398FD4|nr:RNA-binding motif protein, X-linked 2-like isoform X1 [Styela clava]
MNILTKIRLLNDLNDRELRLGITGTKASWHEQYKDSAWIYTGGLPFELSEGDVICVFSQYGEIVNINMIRDKKTGKSKGFAFLCYQDQRSTILAVDNLNGAKIKGRQIKVDHVLNYKPPKDDDDVDELTRQMREEGVAPKVHYPDIPSPQERKKPPQYEEKPRAEVKKMPLIPIKREKLDISDDDDKQHQHKTKKRKKMQKQRNINIKN